LYSSLLNEQSSNRQHYIRKVIGVVPFMLATLIVVTAAHGQKVPFIPNGTFFPNPGGASQTCSTTGGGIDQTGPFFQSLGTNGRTCGSCHQPSDGMSVSARDLQLRFLHTRGQDRIFRSFDASNCSHNIDVSNPCRDAICLQSVADAGFDPYSHRCSRKRRLSNWLT